MELRVQASGASDVGRVRRTNEDAFGFDLNRGLFVVCDGVGGANAGEVASQSAVDCLLRVFPSQSADREAGGPELERAIQSASRSIFQAAERDVHFSNMATTIVAAHFDGERMWIAHVGDSRAYLLRGDAMHRLTEDHSQLVERLRAGGQQMDAEEAHRLDSTLTQALGASDQVFPEVTVVQVEIGDCFVLATDGVTKALTLAEMVGMLHGMSSPQVACKELIQAANAAGGEDNSTCLVIALTDV